MMKKFALSLSTIALLQQVAFGDVDEEKQDYIKVGQLALYNNQIDEATEAFKHECNNDYIDQLKRSNGCLFAGYVMELINEKENAIEYYKQACDNEIEYSATKRGKACLLLKKYEKTGKSSFDGMDSFRYLDSDNTTFAKEEGTYDETTSICTLEQSLKNDLNITQLLSFYAEGYATRFDELEAMFVEFSSLNPMSGVEEMIATQLLPVTFELMLDKPLKNGKKIVTVDTTELAQKLFFNYYNLTDERNVYKFIDKSILVRAMLIKNKITDKEIDKDNCKIFYDPNIYFEDLVGLVALLKEKNRSAYLLAYLLLTNSTNNEITNYILQDKKTKENYLAIKEHFNASRIPFDPKKVEPLPPQDTPNSNEEVKETTGFL